MIEKSVNRISWDNLFMSIVNLYAQRSACKYFKIGAVFVRDNRILSAGYNGPPTREPHCIEVGCAKEFDGQRMPSGSYLCRGGHAEMNAIANASIQGVNLQGSTVYCTYSPCYDCSKILANIGISEYVYGVEFDDEKGNGAIQLFKNKGIITRRFES